MPVIDSPNILIISDLHLTQKFDQKKYFALTNLINAYDQVIINSDFQDNWFTTFDKFVNSDWKQLFPLLEKKKTIYIYNNHNLEVNSDRRVNLFSNRTQKFLI